MPLHFQPSVRWLIAACVLVPLVVVAAALSLLSIAASSRIAEKLGESIVTASINSVMGQVSRFLGEAEAISELYARRIERGVLGTDTLADWRPFMLDDLATRPHVASICLGNSSGDATWLLWHDSQLEYGLVDGNSSDATEWALDLDDRRAYAPLRTYKYDPRKRPWYDAALAAEAGVWTPIYFWFGNGGAASETGTGFTRAIRAPDGQLRGVLVIDVTLSGLSDFLHKLPAAREGFVYVVDGEGLLVAASDGPVNTPQGQRMALADSTSAGAVAAQGLLSRHRDAGSVHGEPARARLVRLQNKLGIDWHIVTVLPESAFLGEARQLQRRIVIASLIALAMCIILGLWLARTIARPILALIGHVQRVGRGDFASRVDLRAARELQQLSDAMNRMTVDLKHHVETQQSLKLAMEVQQALLPERDPATPSLDLAGRSRYCDATGGDYYDFVDVSSLNEHATLIAVGDVMGHGIAAALLMASARAALRAHSDQAHDVAQLLTGVNRVLAKDARHNRFMTMLLAVIDPQTRALHWASAGHDPPFVYLPGDDCFDEIDGGDLPLGVMEDVTYVQYDRPNLPPGALIVIGTDGVWELNNAAGHQYGKERLRAIIRNHHAAPAAEIARAIEDALADFRGDHAPQDDITFVVAKLT